MDESGQPCPDLLENKWMDALPNDEETNETDCTDNVLQPTAPILKMTACFCTRAEQRRRMQEMTPRERQEFDAEQQSISEFSAAGGGIAKLAGKESGPPPEKGPDSEGLASLLKNVKKR